MANPRASLIEDLPELIFHFYLIPILAFKEQTQLQRSSTHFWRLLKPSVSQQKVNYLLKLLAEGELDKAREIIQNDPAILTLKGQFVDPWGDICKNISVIQYIYLTGNKDLFNTLVKYISREEVSRELLDLETQCSNFRDKIINAVCALETALRDFQNYIHQVNWLNPTPQNVPDLTELLLQIGRTQRLLPACVIRELYFKTSVTPFKFGDGTCLYPLEANKGLGFDYILGFCKSVVKLTPSQSMIGWSGILYQSFDSELKLIRALNEKLIQLNQIKAQITMPEVIAAYEEARRNRVVT